MDNAVVQEFRSVFMVAVEYGWQQFSEEMLKIKLLVNEHFPEKKSILKSSRDFLFKKVFRFSAEDMLDINKIASMNLYTAEKLVKKVALFDPELARHLQGLNAVVGGFTVMHTSLEKTGSKYISRFLEDFINAYRENPQISDVEVMAMFFRKENVLNKKTMPDLDLIDPARSAELNLGIREHILTFIQKNNLLDA